MGKRSTRHEEEDDWQPTRSTGRPKVEEGGSPSSTSTTAGAKSGRKPGRTSVACSQCRQRKSNCSLSGPACEACLARGDGESCSFQAFLWIEDPEQLPSRQLKAKVDRLEELLRTLGSSPQPSSSLSLPSPPPTAIPPTFRPSPTPSLVVPPIRASHSRASSAPAAVDASVVVPRPVNRARQLAQRILTRLVFAGEDVPQISIPNFDPTFLAAQLSRIEEQYAATVPFFAHPTPSALHAVISAEEYDRCVRAVLPTTQQAQLTLNAFFVLVNPFLGLIHPPTFLAQCEEFWHSGSMPEGAWLATYFLACGNGLSAMSDEIGNGVVPVGEAKEFLVRTWNDAGRRVLAANNFVPKPTIEGIRALHLLLQWWCVDGGRYFEASLSITATIAGAVAELGLNRDPEEDDSNMDPAEHQTRRRIYWATYCHDAMIRGAVGHPWSPYSEEEITVRFPVDDAAASDIPTPLYSAAILNARITKLTTRIKPLTKEEVSSVLDELEALDEPYAKDVLRFAMVRWGYVRLQRFAAKAGVTDGGRQDELSAIYFEELLNSTDAMASAPAGLSSVILLKMLSLAVSAAVDLAGTPFALAVNDPTAMIIARLVQTLRQRSFRTSLSRVVARGVAIIEHLLPTPAEQPPIQADFYAEPVPEYNYDAPKLETGSKARTIPGFDVFPSPQLYHDQPGAEPRRYLPSPLITEFSPSLQQQTLHQQYIPTPTDAVPPGPFQSFVRASRPTLNVFTSMAPPAPASAAPTPINWVDTAITPSRYVPDCSWERFT